MKNDSFMLSFEKLIPFITAREKFMRTCHLCSLKINSPSFVILAAEKIKPRKFKRMVLVSIPKKESMKNKTKIWSAKISLASQS